MNVIFVKFGTKYSADDVNKLAEKVSEVGPMYCYTDDPTDVNVECIAPIGPLLKGVWNKLALFSSDFPVKGKTLYIDLDTIVQMDPSLLTHMWEDTPGLGLIHNPGKTEIINEANYDVDINSSIMHFDNTEPFINDIWDHFVNSGFRDYFLRKYDGIDRYIYHEEFETYPLDISTSWKYDLEHNRPFITFEEMEFNESVRARFEGRRRNL